MEENTNKSILNNPQTTAENQQANSVPTQISTPSAAQTPLVSPNVPQPPTPQLQTKTSSKLYPKLILIILFIFVLVVGSYFAYKNGYLNKLISNTEYQPSPEATATITPTPIANPTEDWETYTNNEAGLSFSYPSFFKLTSCDSSQSKFPALVLNFMANGKAVSCGGSYNVDVNIKYYPGDYVSDTSYLYSSRYKFTRSEIEVGDKKLKSEKIELISLLPNQDPVLGPLPQTCINIPYPLVTNPTEYGYLVFCYLPDKIDQIIIDQILSTFKFLDTECPDGQVIKTCKLGPCCCPIGALCD